MNPPLLMPLVEITSCAYTEPRVVQLVVGLMKRCGKHPIELPHELPGFVWNRLQFAVLREALSLVELGVIDAATIDLIFEKGLGRRWGIMGPLKSVAAGGSATFLRAAREILPDLSSATDLDGLDTAVKNLQPTLDDIRHRNVELARAFPTNPITRQSQQTRGVDSPSSGAK